MARFPVAALFLRPSQLKHVLVLALAAASLAACSQLPSLDQQPGFGASVSPVAVAAPPPGTPAGIVPASAGPSTATAPPVSLKWQTVNYLSATGAPKAISQSLVKEFDHFALVRHIALVVDGTETDARRSIRVLLSIEAAKASDVPSKLIFLWDVRDPAGKTIRQMEGEVPFDGAFNRAAPWTSVTATMLGRIAAKGVEALGAPL